MNSENSASQVVRFQDIQPGYEATPQKLQKCRNLLSTIGWLVGDQRRTAAKHGGFQRQKKNRFCSGDASFYSVLAGHKPQRIGGFWPSKLYGSEIRMQCQESSSLRPLFSLSPAEVYQISTPRNPRNVITFTMQSPPNFRNPTSLEIRSHDIQ